MTGQTSTSQETRYGMRHNGLALTGAAAKWANNLAAAGQEKDKHWSRKARVAAGLPANIDDVPTTRRTPTATREIQIALGFMIREVERTQKICSRYGEGQVLDHVNSIQAQVSALAMWIAQHDVELIPDPLPINKRGYKVVPVRSYD